MKIGDAISRTVNGSEPWTDQFVTSQVLVHLNCASYFNRMRCTQATKECSMSTAHAQCSVLTAIKISNSNWYIHQIRRIDTYINQLKVHSNIDYQIRRMNYYWKYTFSVFSLIFLSLILSQNLTIFHYFSIHFSSDWPIHAWNIKKSTGIAKFPLGWK